MYIFLNTNKLQKLPLLKRTLLMRERQLDKSKLSSILVSKKTFYFRSLKIFKKMNVCSNHFVAFA
jgi:hypothetical protein